MIVRRLIFGLNNQIVSNYLHEMSVFLSSINLPIVETEDLGLYELNKNNPSSSIDNYPINRQIFSFREDNLEIKCCVGIFWNKKSNQYYVQIFLKKFKSKSQKLLLTDSELFLKCSFDGFGIYYCAISNSHLTNFYIHRKFSTEGTFVNATFEIIPFLPFKLDLDFQLIPLLAISHSPVIPLLRYYDVEWPFVSYIRQILASSDGTIICPPQVINQKCDSHTFSVANIDESDCKNMVNQIFGVTKSVCEELGSKYQAIYGIPEVVYTNQSKIKLNSDTDFLIYALPPEYQSEIPTIISVDFADQNPFHLCSIIRKEIDNDFYFLTIYSPSLDVFYTVTSNNISSINSKPRCCADEYIISALYVRLNVLNLFRSFSLSPHFNPRFNLVTVYEVAKIFYLTDFCNEISSEELKKSIPIASEKPVRSDDLDDEQGIALFPYIPKETFPSIPLTCSSSRSILKLQIPPEIKKFQLIWFCHDNFQDYSPVVVDLTNTSCIQIPKIIGKSALSYDLIHLSSNYLTTPYKIEDSLPTGPMILFKCLKETRLMKACSISFGKRIATNSLNQFTQPPVYFYSDKFSLSKKLKNVKEARKIDKCNCYIRTYIKGTKTLWIKLGESDIEIDSYMQEKIPTYRDHNFIQFFVEIQ